MTSLSLSAAILLLLPGLIVYSGLFGLFAGHWREKSNNDSAVTPIPPSPNSIKSTTIILGSAIAIQGLTAALLHGLVLLSKTGISFGPLFDPYHFAGNAEQHMDAPDVGSLSLFLALQCILAYWQTRAWLRRRIKQDTAPRWLFGWANEFANSADGQIDGKDIAVVAVVLTDMDVAMPYAGVRSVAYAGIVRDLSLSGDGSILRLNLKDASRFLVDMKQNIIDGDDGPPLSFFQYMSISAAHIRNVSFRKLHQPDPPIAP